MKRPTDIEKWSGVSNHDGTRRRQPWRKRLTAREKEFRIAPIEALWTMAKVAGQPFGALGSNIYPVPIYKYVHGQLITRYLMIPLNDQHAAIWTPEKGIEVVSRERVEQEWM